MNYVSTAIAVEIIEHNPNLREYIFQLKNPRKYKPGSFVQLTLENVSASEIWPESRTFSVASFEHDRMRFFIKKQGKYTTRIFETLSIGSECTIKFPFGDLFEKKSLDENHVFIAGGVGITPYFGLIDYFESINLLSNISLHYSVKEVKDYLYIDVLKVKLGSRLKLYLTQEKNESYINRRIELKDITNLNNTKDNIYICGTKNFNDYFRKNLVLEGYKKIHMDEWE